jgi:hypothetical protein
MNSSAIWFAQLLLIQAPRYQFLARVILCNRSNCEDIADYLEVNERGGEYFAGAATAKSVLGKQLPC